MAHDTSAEFDAAAEASVNDVSSDVLIGWQKAFDAGAAFFELDVSDLDGGDYLRGSGDDVTFFDAYQYQEENDNVDSWSVTRVAGQIPYGLFYAQADIVLDNISKRYLPGFDPDIGDFIKSRRPIKIFSGLDGENLQQFVGFTGDPKTKILERKTRIHAFDGMDYFESVETDTDYYSEMTFDEILVDLLEEQGFSSDQFNIEASTQGDIGYFRTAGKKLGDIFREGAEAEQGIIFIDEDGIIQFWNRFHFSQNATIESALSYDNVKDYEYSETPIINHVITYSQPRAIAAAQSVYTSDNSVEIPAGETVTITLNFEDVYGQLPLIDSHTPVHFDDVDGSNKSFYQTNTASDGGGTQSEENITLDSYSLIETTAFVKFTNTSGSSMYITEIDIWGTPVKVTASYEREYKDEASIAEYGTNPDNDGVAIEYTNNLIQDDDTAYAYSLNMVAEYSDGSQQVKVTPFANPARKFGDAVTFYNDEVDGEDDPKKFVVIGTKISGGLDAVLEQELILDQRIFVKNFELDVSSLDGSHVIAA